MRRKIFLSFITLTLLITVFTTSTYAWFKINSSAMISGFDFEVHGGEGFVISADGEKFYNQLSQEQVLEAIVYGFDKETYEYQNSNLVYKETGQEVTNEELLQLVKKLELTPLTSNDGVSFQDMLGATHEASSGKYIEFDLYFKATSNEIKDNLKYEIYFNNLSTVADDGTKVNPINLSSNTSALKVEKTMVTPDKTYNRGDYVNVDSLNATRLSVLDTTVENKKATIYEFYNKNDLGSYATDYNGEDQKLNRLYNSNINAMFTYYNNLKAGLSHLEPLSYDEMPNSIRYELSSGLEFEKPITTVMSGPEVKKVTFRIWIEGWDADCFDGLFETISVKLTFKSKQIYN